VNDIVDLVDGTETIDGLYGDIKISDIVDEFYTGWHGDPLYEKILDTLAISDIVALYEGRTTAEELFGDVLLGDLAAKPFETLINNLFGDYDIDFDGTAYSVKGFIERPTAKLINTTIPDIIKVFESMENLKTYFGEFKIGEFLAEAVNATVSRFVDHTVIFDENDMENTVFEVEGWYAVIMKEFYNMKLFDAYDNFESRKTAEEFFKQFKVGDYVDRALNILTSAVSMEHNIHIGESGDYVVDNWFVKPAAALYNLTLGDAIDTFSSLENTKAFMAQFKVGDFTEELTYAASRVIDHDMEYDEESDKYYATGWYEIIASAIYDMNARTAIETFTDFNETQKFFKQFKVGDYVDRALNIVLKFVSMEHNIHIGESGDYVVDNWFVKPAAALYNLTLGEAIDTFSSLENTKAFMAQFKVGDFTQELTYAASRVIDHDMEYDEESDTYYATGWYKIIASAIYDMNARTAIETFTNVTEAKLFFRQFRVGDYVDRIVNIVSSAVSMQHNVHFDDNGDYAADVWFVKPAAAIYNMTLGDAIDTFKSVNGAVEFVRRFKIGDFAADVANKTVALFVNHNAYYKADEDYYFVTGYFEPIADQIYNMDVSYALDTFTSLSAVKSYFYGFKVGDY
ncbi:MAG: hypothetical protein J6T42_04495, partial [Clostridia bacterium]|nr:hypothetical protein [Clostridia bacterium]